MPGPGTNPTTSIGDRVGCRSVIGGPTGRTSPRDQVYRGCLPRLQSVEGNRMLIASIPTNTATGALFGNEAVTPTLGRSLQEDGLMGAKPDAGVATVALLRVDVRLI